MSAAAAAVQVLEHMQYISVCSLPSCRPPPFSDSPNHSVCVPCQHCSAVLLLLLHQCLRSSTPHCPPQSLFVAICLGLTPAIKLVPTAVLWGYFAFMSLESLPGSQVGMLCAGCFESDLI